MADAGEEVVGRFLDARPRVSPSAFVAPGTWLVGDVVVGDEASVWYGSVLRGDINRIVIGPRSNIQDGSVVHLADDLPCLVGELVTCGHRAILHACTVADEVLVGMGAIVMDGAEIGPRSVVGAGALVTMGMKVPEGSLVLGSPARVVRRLDPGEQRSVKSWAEKYVALSRRYLGLAAGGGS
jgi:carbonic anhydrase/acetyltransferase-like protein (isoleucine patch superfamily)